MAESIKLNGDKYIDATGVYDSTQGKTQSVINTPKSIGLTNYNEANVLSNGNFAYRYGKLIIFTFAMYSYVSIPSLTTLTSGFPAIDSIVISIGDYRFRFINGICENLSALPAAKYFETQVILKASD